MAATAAYRVEVTILWIVGLLAEAGVGGVLATGAALATSPSSHPGLRLGVLGFGPGSGDGGGHGHAIFSYGRPGGALYGRLVMMLLTILPIPLLFISAAGFSLVQSTRSLSLLAVQTHLALLRESQMDKPVAS